MYGVLPLLLRVVAYITSATEYGLFLVVGCSPIRRAWITHALSACCWWHGGLQEANGATAGLDRLVSRRSLQSGSR